MAIITSLLSTLLALFVVANLIYRYVQHARCTVPISVNYHFTRKCNKTCKFCFHTEKSSYVAEPADWKRGLKMLKDAGMRKINFAGGEPFLYPRDLAEMVKYCKEDLKLESVSIISNGTKVTDKWLRQHGQYVDVLGISCDSFVEKVNEAIGRGTGDNVKQLFQIKKWCDELGIKFKLNTVVCTLNWQEDMATIIDKLQPFRWKCFQVLLVESENDATTADTKLDKRKRDARELLITKEQFDAFCDKHKHLACFVRESNDLMALSYLILDEYLCFLDKGEGKEKLSSSILEVGVQRALEQVKWDREAFVERGGLYAWTRDGGSDCGTSLPENLEF